MCERNRKRDTERWIWREREQEREGEREKDREKDREKERGREIEKVRQMEEKDKD